MLIPVHVLEITCAALAVACVVLVSLGVYISNRDGQSTLKSIVAGTIGTIGVLAGLTGTILIPVAFYYANHGLCWLFLPYMFFVTPITVSVSQSFNKCQAVW